MLLRMILSLLLLLQAVKAGEHTNGEQLSQGSAQKTYHILELQGSNKKPLNKLTKNYTYLQTGSKNNLTKLTKLVHNTNDHVLASKKRAQETLQTSVETEAKQNITKYSKLHNLTKLESNKNNNYTKIVAHKVLYANNRNNKWRTNKPKNKKQKQQNRSTTLQPATQSQPRRRKKTSRQIPKLTSKSTQFLNTRKITTAAAGVKKYSELVQQLNYLSERKRQQMGNNPRTDLLSNAALNPKRNILPSDNNNRVTSVRGIASTYTYYMPPTEYTSSTNYDLSTNYENTRFSTPSRIDYETNGYNVDDWITTRRPSFTNDENYPIDSNEPFSTNSWTSGDWMTTRRPPFTDDENYPAGWNQPSLTNSWTSVNNDFSTPFPGMFTSERDVLSMPTSFSGIYAPNEEDEEMDDNRFESSMSRPINNVFMTTPRPFNLDEEEDSRMTRFSTLDNRFSSSDNRFSTLDNRFSSSDNRFTSSVSRGQEEDEEEEEEEEEEEYNNNRFTTVSPSVDVYGEQILLLTELAGGNPIPQALLPAPQVTDFLLKMYHLNLLKSKPEYLEDDVLTFNFIQTEIKNNKIEFPLNFDSKSFIAKSKLTVPPDYTGEKENAWKTVEYLKIIKEYFVDSKEEKKGYQITTLMPFVQRIKNVLIRSLSLKGIFDELERKLNGQTSGPSSGNSGMNSMDDDDEDEDEK